MYPTKEQTASIQSIANEAHQLLQEAERLKQAIQQFRV
jgi:methyl-accepting chemotaxis protein